MSKSTLSFVINTKNSAQTIVRTLQSIRQIADEIIIIDMQSSDKTVELARKYTDRVFSYKDVGYVEPARNFAVGKSKSDWVMIIDDDEEVSPGLREFLIDLKEEKIKEELKADCYFIPRRNIIFDKKIEKTGWWPDFQLRLFRSGRVEWLEEIHSIPITTGKTIELPASDRYALIHHNYQTVEQFVERLNRYTSIEAREDKKIDVSQLLNSYFDQILTRMFANRGIDEGIHGVGLSMLQANYQLLTLLKVWQRQGFKQTKKDQDATINSLTKFQSDINYWIADYRVENSSGLVKLYWQIRRKFKI